MSQLKPISLSPSRRRSIRFMIGLIVCVAAALGGDFAIAADTAPTARTPLWPAGAPSGDGTVDKETGFITVHLPPADKANGAAMVICPGGGYGGLVVGPEGHGIAQWLNAHGVVGIVLEYRLPKGRSMVPLIDAKHAIRTVRSKAAEWKIDPKRVGIIGFSAGGHLASSAATHFDDGDKDSTDPIERGFSSRPDFAVLVYPVVSMGLIGHGGSRRNLLGQSPSEELTTYFSNEKQVTKKTPPMFLTHAKNDTVVVPENSRLLHEALKVNDVATEYLELPTGGHGLNGYKGPMWDAWQKDSLAWLAKLKIIPEADAAAQ
jgi:acetyl esterase/lipase